MRIRIATAQSRTCAALISHVCSNYGLSPQSEVVPIQPFKQARGTGTQFAIIVRDGSAEVTNWFCDTYSALPASCLLQAELF